MQMNTSNLFWMTILTGALSLSFLNGAQPASPPSNQTQNEDENPEDSRRLSEAFGHFIGRNLKNPGLDFDLEMIIKGMRAGAQGLPPPMPDDEYERLMTAHQAKAFRIISEKNLQEANEFLVNNAKKVGIIEIEPQKLQYMVLEKGKGDLVKEKDTPLINYTGKFINGEIFSSSEQTGGPINIPLDQTIPGFQKGLVGMREGEKRRLFVHPDLAYGASGQLPPNSLLIFDIEVMKADTTPDNDEDMDDTDSDDDSKWSQW